MQRVDGNKIMEHNMHKIEYYYISNIIYLYIMAL